MILLVRGDTRDDTSQPCQPVTNFILDELSNTAEIIASQSQYLDIPWWGSIMLTAVLLRIVVFPTVVWAQRNAAKMNDVAPQMQVLQEKMTEAKARGDVYEQSVLGGELQQFMKKHDVSPFKNFYPILMQAPFFMSMFMGLRGMANLPVPSMETESFLWISDLSLRDPYFLTPIFISGTMYLQFYLAADGANLQQMGPIAKGVMRIVPIGLFFITFKFPAVKRAIFPI